MEAEEIKSCIDEIISLKERLIEIYDKLGMFEVFPRILNVYDYRNTFDEIMESIDYDRFSIEYIEEHDLTIKSINYGDYIIKEISNKKSSDNTDQSTVTTNA